MSVPMERKVEGDLAGCRNLVFGMIRDAVDNVRSYNREYGDESRRFLSNENGALQEWLEIVPGLSVSAWRKKLNDICEKYPASGPEHSRTKGGRSTSKKMLVYEDGTLVTCRAVADRYAINYSTLTRRSRYNPHYTVEQLVDDSLHGNRGAGKVMIKRTDGSEVWLADLVAETGVPYNTMFSRHQANPDYTAEELAKERHLQSGRL